MLSVKHLTQQQHVCVVKATIAMLPALRCHPPNRPLEKRWKPAVMMSKYLPSMVVAIDCMSCLGKRAGGWVAGGQGLR
jgi:hypothetical protein